VEKLCIDSENLVEKRTERFFFDENPRESSFGCLWTRASYVPSLVFGSSTGTMPASIPTPDTLAPPPVGTVFSHRIHTIIAGREYTIEVARVADNRWRAQIVRLPGLPTALMPFYASTPDDAAAQLSEWLTRAYQHAATTL
jgi:hypothetical protein